MNDTPTPSPKTVLEITDDPTVCRMVIESLVRALQTGPKSRARSLAATKLEEAGMWLNEALRTE